VTDFFQTRSFRRGAIILFVGLLALLLIDGVREVRVFDSSASDLLARSRHIRDHARPTYQEDVLAVLPQNLHNGIFYRLDEMASEAVVLEEPVLSAVQGDSARVFAFEFDDRDPIRLELVGGRSDLQIKEGVLSVRHLAGDYLTNSVPLQIPKDDVGSIVIRARARRAGRLTLGWSRETDPTNVWRHMLSIDLVGDTCFHTYAINAKNALKRGLNVGDDLRRLVLRPSNLDSAQVEIDFIRFVSKQAEYMQEKRGVTYETIGFEMRPVLYMLPPQAIQFSVNLPEETPTLDFGAAILSDDEPVTFSVSVANDARGVERIYEQTIQSSEAWHDVRLDLSNWAGEDARLTLRVSGPGENVAFWSNPFISSPPRQQFNVVVILEDALRADHLSTYGYERPTSPVKDSLMREDGIVFSHAFSQATKTRPSVPSLMTSLLPTHTGVWGWRDALSKEYLTLAEVMRVQGFVTASLIQNGNAGPYVGLHQGFSMIWDEETLEPGTEGIFGERLIEWLKRRGDRNFFLYLHIADPHGAYNPPKPFDTWYHEATSQGWTPVERLDYLDPAWVVTPTAEGRNLLYDGEIRHNDALLPRLLAALDSLGSRENTLLVFTADHGEYLGEHGLWEHHPPGHLQVIGVPLMLSYPSRFQEPRRIPQVVQLLDVMPTILELAGVDSNELLLAGSSLVDLIEGRRIPYWKDRIAVSEEPTAMSRDAPCPCGSLFFRNWHLIASSELRGVPFALDRRAFDFRSHPQETRLSLSPTANLLAWYKHRRVIRELQENNMEAWRLWTGKTEDYVLKVDPDVLERLRTLGYIRN
jgi:arylsulfatase